MVGANHAAYTDRFHELAKLVPHLVTLESARIKRVMRRGRPVEETSKSGGVVEIKEGESLFYEWWKAANHLLYNYPKLNRVPGQAGNPLALEGNRNNWNNGNRATGRAFNVNVNAVEALQDPKVVTGTFSLNDNFATDIDRIIRDCKLETREILVLHKFDTVGWFEITLGKDSGYLGFKGNVLLGAAKALMNAKVDEPKLSDISVVRDFVDVFPEDFFKELQTGFLRSDLSHSPLGSTVLFLKKKDGSFAWCIDLLECYYRRFITNSSKVAKPLASLMQKIQNLLRYVESRIRLCTHAKGKVENVTAEMLRGMDQLIERKEDGRTDKTYYDLRDMYGGHVWRRILLPMTWWKIYFAALVDIAEGVENTAVDKTLCFVEEPVEIIDHEVKSLKRSRIPIVKSIGTRSESCYAAIRTLIWAIEVDHVKAKYFRLFVDDDVEPISLSLMRFPLGWGTVNNCALRVACRDLEAAFEYPVAHGLLSCYYMLCVACVCCCIVLRLLCGQEVSSTLCGYEPVCATVPRVWNWGHHSSP
ncbi:hypothetical protein Tco_1019782 [Tanacetum coccineum]|uniref:Reverse transcriptase domain-containing protein n=1 Tax=Tanacetum coccineum TaxID=301880 RepID=A0ABQ5G0E6_9ASTR